MNNVGVKQFVIESEIMVYIKKFMSESHFIRIFKKETGLAPREFLIKTRIDKARKLLRSRTRNITEVSLQCGFSSTSHFSSSFTKHMGMSPSEYQNNFNEQQNKQDFDKN